MAKMIDLDNAMDIATLYDWYITSVSQEDEPVWTEKHIDELFNDFYVIPKETPVIDAEPVNHGKWVAVSHFPYPDTIKCSNCGKEFDGKIMWIRCPICEARMDGE